MKNLQKGFIIPILIIAAVVVLGVGGFMYYKTQVPVKTQIDANTSSSAKQAIQDQYNRERTTGAQNPAPRNPNTPIISVPNPPFETGFFEGMDCDSYHGVRIRSCWAGIVNGKETLVSAGVEVVTEAGGDPQQGVVCVFASCTLTPVRAGAVRIVAEKNGVLTLLSVAGSYVFTFDVNTKTFTSTTSKASP